MADKKIKLLVVYSDRTGVGKFRSIGPHSYIQKHYSDDFDIDIVGINDIPSEGLESFLKKYDLIHFHKQLDSNMIIINMIKFLGIPCIIDVDDYFHLGNDHPMSIASKREKWYEPVIKHIKAADYVTTTTPIYAETLKKYNDKVFVLPNAIDEEEKQFSTSKNVSDRLRIGIICGSTHLHDIELMEHLSGVNCLDKIQYVLCGFDTRGTITTFDMETGKSVRKPILPQQSVWAKYEKIITDNYRIVSPEHKKFLLSFIPNIDDPFINEPYRRMWTKDISQYGSHYQNVDVSLAPLKENEFNKMKSQLKEIEAGFTNTALIAEKFGPYTIDLTSMIEYGGKVNEDANSLLVEPSKNHKQWSKYIEKLAANPDMVTKLQSNLHKFVIENYSMKKIAEERVNLYKSILGRK